jgi:uncharacterized membrane protein SpoIIM required for sporulation
MLPELILKEERLDNFALLFILGAASAFMGILAAAVLFPSEASILSVVFASIPLVYPLATKFLEAENSSEESYMEEIQIYAALFLGETFGFTLLSLFRPDMLSLQAEIAGVTGMATQPGLFMSIFTNNMMVFGGILTVSAVIGSAGAFILVWNASVLGKFFGVLLSSLEGFDVITGSSQSASPIAYVPHATFEMTGFILAGISGSLVSAAVYREHFDRDTWWGILKLVLTGMLCIYIGAVLETA